MTISLEEHVARAIAAAELKWKADNGGDYASIVDCPDDVKARAAIAAVRECDANGSPALSTTVVTEYPYQTINYSSGGISTSAPDPAEAVRDGGHGARNNLLTNRSD